MDNAYVDFNAEDDSDVKTRDLDPDDERPNSRQGPRPKRGDGLPLYGSANTATPMPIFGKTYLTESRMHAATQAVLKKILNVSKAAQKYKVPRSTLQRKMAQIRNEYERRSKGKTRKIEIQDHILDDGWERAFQKDAEMNPRPILVDDDDEEDIAIIDDDQIDVEDGADFPVDFLDTPSASSWQDASNLLGIGSECIVSEGPSPMRLEESEQYEEDTKKEEEGEEEAIEEIVEVHEECTEPVMAEHSTTVSGAKGVDKRDGEEDEEDLMPSITNEDDIVVDDIAPPPPGASSMLFHLHHHLVDGERGVVERGHHGGGAALQRPVVGAGASALWRTHRPPRDGSMPRLRAEVTDRYPVRVIDMSNRGVMFGERESGLLLASPRRKRLLPRDDNVQHKDAF